MDIYCPSSLLAAVYPALARRFMGGLLRIEKPKPGEALDIDSLHCFFLRLQGRTAFVRTPYVYPLLLRQLRDSWHSEGALLEIQPGVDWLYLGGPAEYFVGLVAEHVTAVAAETIALHPYLRLRGILGQTQRDGDVPLTLKATQPNFNQSGWETLKERFLELPESDWTSLGCANVFDFSPYYTAPIETYLQRAPRRILDLGCGLGQTARSLATRFPQARVTGMDLSQEAITIAKAKFSLPNLDFVVSDISNPLPDPQGSADVIVSSNALAYAVDQCRTARELFALLAPDGLLLNVSRLEESNMYFDFPCSLLLPTNHVLQLADWLEAANELGFGTRVEPFVMGFGPDYFHAGAYLEFELKFQALIDKSNQGLAEHHPHLSHGLIIHSRRLALPSVHQVHASYLKRLEEVLLSFFTADDQVKGVTVMSWNLCRMGMELGREFFDFCVACLPGAHEVAGLAMTNEIQGRSLS